MIFGSVCSGIESASVAWAPLGWSAAWFSEIEKFPSAVLQHHYPDVPNLGDMTRIHEDERFKNTAIDLLVGGTPCQSFSVAGLRKGLDDPRGNLALVFLGLVDRARPRWVVWENVPGVLSSNGGRDFGAFVTALGQLGYGWAYRVLDAKNVGGCAMHGRPPVPQRRRRVFVVGYLGDWRRATAVLLERHSFCGDFAQGRKKKAGLAGAVSAGPAGSSECAAAMSFTPSQHGGYREGVGSLRAAGGDLGGGSENLIVRVPAPMMFDPYNSAVSALSPSLGTNCGMSTGRNIVLTATIRRLTPEEAERLQGFVPGYSQVPYRGKPAADTPRYRAIGNSMAIPCMSWIGKRIQAVDAQ